MPSTVIRTFDYDAATRALDVDFVSGRRYRYAGVPEDVAQALRAAFAKGRFFNTHIRDNFACHKLQPESEGLAMGLAKGLGAEWA